MTSEKIVVEIVRKKGGINPVKISTVYGHWALDRFQIRILRREEYIDKFEDMPGFKTEDGLSHDR